MDPWPCTFIPNTWQPLECLFIASSKILVILKKSTNNISDSKSVPKTSLGNLAHSSGQEGESQRVTPFVWNIAGLGSRKTLFKGVKSDGKRWGLSSSKEVERLEVKNLQPQHLG